MRSHRIRSVYFTMIAGMLAVGGPAGACGDRGEEGASAVSFKDVVDQRQKANQLQRAADEERIEIERSYGAAVAFFMNCQSDSWRASDAGNKFEALATDLDGRYRSANSRLRSREILIIEQETLLEQERVSIEDRRKARLSDYDEEFDAWTQRAFCFYAGPATEFAERKRRLNEMGRSLATVYVLANESCSASSTRVDTPSDDAPRNDSWLAWIGSLAADLTDFAMRWTSLR